MGELNKCPFCGGKAKHELDMPWRYVECTECGSSGGEAYSIKEAVAAWNGRYACLDENGKKVFAGDAVNVYYPDAKSETGTIEWDVEMLCWAIHIENQGNYRFHSDTEIELIEETDK